MNFEGEVYARIGRNETNAALRNSALEFMLLSIQAQYSYNFSWLGRPIIQYPQDMVAMQELIWLVKPDLIVETGIAHGGSLIMNASLLALIDYSEAIEKRKYLDPRTGGRRVLGIDIEVRSHNRVAIENHPMAHKIDIIEGNSVDPDIIARVYDYARQYKTILICLDSNHTHSHVLAELEAYAPLTSVGSYTIVFDTIIQDMPDKTFSDRPWSKGDNPKTAVREYLNFIKQEGRKAADGMPLTFEVDKMMENKLVITVAPEGFLKRKE